MTLKTEPLRNSDYSARGDYHKELDPNWSYYLIYLAKRKWTFKEIDRLEKVGKCLDVGCGEGAFVEDLRQNGHDAIGLDINYESDIVRRGDITEMPFASESFDTVLCLDVLEHLPFDKQKPAVKEINRVLKKEGRCILSIPNLAHLFSRLSFLLRGTLVRTASTRKHPGDRPIGEFIDLIEDCGFTILRRKGIFLTFPGAYQIILGEAPKKYAWLLSLTDLLAFPNLCFQNILVCSKKEL